MNLAKRIKRRDIEEYKQMIKKKMKEQHLPPTITLVIAISLLVIQKAKKMQLLKQKAIYL